MRDCESVLQSVDVDQKGATDVILIDNAKKNHVLFEEKKEEKWTYHKNKICNGIQN